MKRAFKTITQHKGKANLWRILRQPESTIFWIEYRSSHGRTLLFDCLDISTGEVLFDGINPDIPWEGGVAAAFSNGLLFHLKKAEGSPVFEGLAYVELPSLSIRWQDDSLFLREIKDQSILVEKDAEQFELNLHTGERILASSSVVDQPKLILDCLFPEQYPEGSAYFEEVKESLRSFGIEQPVRMMDYLEKAPYVFIGFYESQDDGLTQRLIVLHVDGSIVDNFTLAQSLKNSGRDTFFILGKYLVLVIEKTDLAVYEIGN